MLTSRVPQQTTNLEVDPNLGISLDGAPPWSSVSSSRDQRFLVAGFRFNNAFVVIICAVSRMHLFLLLFAKVSLQSQLDAADQGVFQWAPAFTRKLHFPGLCIHCLLKVIKAQSPEASVLHDSTATPIPHRLKAKSDTFEVLFNFKAVCASVCVNFLFRNNLSSFPPWFSILFYHLLKTISPED